MQRTVVQIEGGQALGQRRRQEDAWGSGTVGTGKWAAVADGMGGHRDGAVASQTAIVALRKFITMTPGPQGGDWEKWLESGVMAAHRAVEALARPGEDTPPGTTMLWAVARGDTCWIAHVGDSRAYLVRGGRVSPLTVDMTLAGERVRDGLKPWDHQNTAYDGHVLVSAMGSAPLLVETFSVDWVAGDVLVLTTDGLNSLPLERWPSFLVTCSVDEILGLAPWNDNATLVVMRHA